MKPPEKIFVRTAHHCPLCLSALTDELKDIKIIEDRVFFKDYEIKIRKGIQISILMKLLAHKGRTVTRESLYHFLYCDRFNDKDMPDITVLDIHTWHLRNSLKAFEFRTGIVLPFVIKTIHGQGYVLRDSLPYDVHLEKGDGITLLELKKIALNFGAKKKIGWRTKARHSAAIRRGKKLKMPVYNLEEKS